MTQSVEISALTGAGCRELAAAVLLQAELASVSAAPDAPADGTVIESRLDKGLGPVFVTIIRDGTLIPQLHYRFAVLNNLL